MAKQLNVNLSFTADVSAAKQQMQNLQRDLDALIKGSVNTKQLPITDDLMKAQNAAASLKVALESAFNTTTGKLDITKFSASMKNANLDAKTLKDQLVALGPAGSQAFMSLSKAIMSADVPIRRTNALISELWTTMKNTVRWQLTSSVLHGFMGTLSSAVGYAKDLDESLNNIRIVSGQNVDQMAKFAENANKAAKALSTTTTAYTNAALIYYQQGDDDATVLEKTDVTAKMANVTGTSAEVVSDQLTAIWNNFNKAGEESYERYADVLTALGAATASSTDEIAGGLEKFASVADMIGLSYDYAATALATITATTRQSEDVVGTALKTIFARIQGLNLGETLEDGTTLNKYSEALQKVGISIYEQNGELKNMDSILNEMGAKWETLSKDQQVALAQTVAGVRQYNQLVSLMDNWDYFGENLEIAKNAEGTLNEQADIYAESWEAARNRVKAAAEDIYDSILDEKAFITILNLFEDLLNLTGSFVDSLNGLPGILSLIGVLFTKIFNKQLTQSIDNIVYGFNSLSGTNLKNAKTEKENYFKEATSISYNDGTEAGAAVAQGMKSQLTLQKQLIDNERNLSEEEKARLRTLMEINQQYVDQAIKAAEAKDAASDKVQEKDSDLRAEASRSNLGSTKEESLKKYREARDQMKLMAKEGVAAEAALNKINKSLSTPGDAHKFSNAIAKVSKHLEKVDRPNAAKSVQRLYSQFKSGFMSAEEFQRKLNDVVTAEELISDTAIAASNQFRNQTKNMVGTEQSVDSLAESDIQLVQATNASNEAMLAQAQHANKVKLAIAGAKGAMDTFAQSVVKGVQGVASISMAIQSVLGIVDTLKNTDMSFGEKLLSVTMSLSMAIPALITGINALREAEIKKNAALAAGAVATLINTTATAASAAADAVKTGASTTLTGSLLTQAAAWILLHSTMSPVLAVIVAIVGPILLLVGAAALLVGIFKSIQANSPEGKLKTLQEQADKSAEAFNRVKDSVNETKSALESLNSAYETIENLTRGTDEWYNAITNVNAEVMKLLDKYPGLISDQVYATEDGMLKITEAGIDAIEKENRMRLQTAQNVNTANKIAAKKQEIEVSQNNFEGMNKIARDSYDDEVADAIQQYYETEGIGEQLFTKEGADALLKGLQDEASFLIKNKVDSEQFYQMLLDNQKQIRENANIHKEINILEDSLIQSRATAVGSTRSADEVRDLIGEDTITKIKDETERDVKLAFSDWNDHINYDKDDEKEWDMIQDFMNLQGDDVEYVAQRHGKMVLEIDGEEREYSKDEVYDALSELYSGPEIESKLEEGFEKSIGDALGRSVANLDVTELAELDNFQRGLADALTGTEYEENSDEVFKSVANTWNVDTEQGFENFQTDTQYIDLTSEAFLRQALALNEGAISAEQFKDAVQELNAQGEILAMNDFFANAAEGLGLDDKAASEMQEYAEYLRNIAKESDLLADSLAEDAESAADLAVEITRMNKGIDDLADGFEDWRDILDNSSKESAEYAAAMSKTKKALSDVLDVEADLVSDDFITQHLDDIAKAATGDEEAIDALRASMDEEIILRISAGKSDEAIAKINTLNDQVQTMAAELPDIEVGAYLNDEEFVATANALVKEAGMTADQANAYFAGIGYEPVAETTEIEGANTTQVPNASTTMTVKSIGFSEEPISIMGHEIGFLKAPQMTIETSSTPLPASDAEANMSLTSFSGGRKAPEIKNFRKKAKGSQNNYSSSNKGGKAPGSSKGGKGGKGGGGGSSKKSEGKPQKTDVVDRYKEIEDKIDDIKNSADKASSAMDRLFGTKKIKKMQEVNKLLENEVDLLKAKRDEASKYLAEDEANLKQAVAKYGGSVKNVELVNGNIDNYDEILSALFNELYTATPEEGAEISDTQQEKIDAIQKRIDKVKEAIAQYDETRESIEDIDNEIQDKIYEWQDNNYEILQYELELKIEINDADLKKLDYYLNKYSDNFYKMVESAELLNKQIPDLKKALSIYEKHKAKLDEIYSNGKMSQYAYIEGLKQIRDGYYESLEALNELDKQMLHYYEDTLSEARSELEDYTDHIEHLTSVFDHYINLMDILGKSKNYEAIGDFLGGKADTIRDRLEVSKEYYNMLIEQKSDIEAKLNAAIAAGDDAAAELYKEEWDAIVDEVDAAQEEVLSLTEEWAEAMKAVIENNMAEIADTLEKTLTGGTTFDTLMDEFDKLNTRQEEYLTKTNQIYETNKLMRTASKALDETDNKVAKQKLKNFIDETKSLQENTKLSKYELEIQQAKYDLLLAEIALEEAKNAKSTVRLSRDSEGNFGYVYTADQDKVNDAQQAYEDADNRLYNLSLEGQQEFTEKYLQATQEMYNQLTELQQAWLNGEISSEEEYERRKEEILNHYLGPEGVLTTYQNLYNIAVRTDADATADNWQKDYGAMTQNTEDWKDAVNKYLVAVEEQTAQWAEVSEQANEDVEGALNDSATATEELTDESENLKDMISEEVIPAIEDELDWVKDQTEAYAEQREELLALIDTYEDYIDAIDKQIEKEAGIKYDKNTDYSALMMGYLAAGGSKDDNQFKELQKQREAKIDGEGYTKEKYGTRGSEFINNIEKNNTWYKDKDAVNKKLKELGIQTFATGGYTGDWGPEGKLAILHEKELILNERDTSNLLSTISFIRDLVSLIDSQATSASLYNLMSTPGVTTSQEVLEQKVEIHAEFPNATDHNEIEEAFNNLVNRASQYANRK